MKEQVALWEGFDSSYVDSQGEHSRARRRPSHSSAKCPDC
jgi:hypothetical protein